MRITVVSPQEMCKDALPPGIFEALNRMDEHTPEYPTALVEELIGDRFVNPETETDGILTQMAQVIPNFVSLYGTDKQKPYFTGWKGFIKGIDMQLEIYDPAADPNDIAWVGQWVSPSSDPSKFIYVNLPGMESGYYSKGGKLNLGQDRIRIDYSKQDLNNLVRVGFEKLCDLIQQDLAEPAK